jgi:hypothetical protein
MPQNLQMIRLATETLALIMKSSILQKEQRTL